jgi:ABC-type microcin C transport system duplicated ATPase subunit YejF
VAPQSDAEGSYDEAERRLLRAVTTLRAEGLDVHGQISHPDPYTAATQAIEDERVNEIIVSTFPHERSGWMRRDLVQRLRVDTKLVVDHIEVDVPERVSV